MEIHELKEFLDLKFDMNNKILDEKFMNMELQLKTIVDQTTRTNGRVTKLENKMEDSEKFSELHILKCPVKKEFDEFKVKLASDLFFFTIIRRYPKISFVVFSTFIVVVAAGGVEGLFLTIKGLLGL